MRTPCIRSGSHGNSVGYSPMLEMSEPLNRDIDQDYIRRTCATFNIGSGAHNRAVGRESSQGPGEAARASCWSRFLKGDYTLIPERARHEKHKLVHWVEVWDLVVLTALFVTAYYVPYEVALLVGSKSIYDYLLSHILDFIFTLDLCLQFFIATVNPSSMNARALYEKQPLKIVARYCSFPLSQGGIAGWFWIDLLSISPVVVDLETHGRYMRQSLCSVRLLRMLRLLRVMRLLDRWNVEFGISRLGQELTKFFFLITCTVHWLACAWLMIEGRVLLHSGSGSWLAPHQKSWLSVLIEAKGDPCVPDADQDPLCVYGIALYWSTMTLTTVGYGDVIPQNVHEYFVCTACMLTSALIWAYIVGCILTLLTSLDPYGMEYKIKMDQLNELMESKGLEHCLRVRLRRFLHESKDIPRVQGEQQLLNSTVSVGLQREVAACSAHILDSVFWTKGIEPCARNELMRRMSCKFFGPQESVQLPDSMLVICKGIMAAKGRILGPGDAWGHESILLDSELLKESAEPNTLSYISVLTLSSTDLYEVRNLFPLMAKRTRNAKVRIAILRWCLSYGVANYWPKTKIVLPVKPPPAVKPPEASEPSDIVTQDDLHKTIRSLEAGLETKQDVLLAKMSQMSQQLESVTQIVGQLIQPSST